MGGLISVRDSVPARRLGSLLRRIERPLKSRREVVLISATLAITKEGHRAPDVKSLASSFPQVDRGIREVGDLDPNRSLVSSLRNHVGVAVGQETETGIGPATSALRSLWRRYWPT